jgi:hypothetical protein
MTDSPANLCTTCGERPQWGALSRCVPCVQAAAEVDRQTRAAAEARVAARGHGPKVAEAVQALRAAGKLPTNLRPVVRDGRIAKWLQEHGYAEDMPSRRAIGRYFKSHLQSAPLARRSEPRISASSVVSRPPDLN